MVAKWKAEHAQIAAGVSEASMPSGPQAKGCAQASNALRLTGGPPPLFDIPVTNMQWCRETIFSSFPTVSEEISLHHTSLSTTHPWWLTDLENHAQMMLEEMV